MRFILGVIIGILVIIFMIQNGEVVDIQFLSWTISIPIAVMVLIIFAFGIIMGWVIRSIGYMKKRRQSEKMVSS